jgi:hypothetical protein
MTQLKHFDLLQSVCDVQHEQITKGIFSIKNEFQEKELKLSTVNNILVSTK